MFLDYDMSYYIQIVYSGTFVGLVALGITLYHRTIKAERLLSDLLKDSHD